MLPASPPSYSSSSDDGGRGGLGGNRGGGLLSLPAPVAPSLLLPLGRGVERRRRHLGRRGLLLLLLELHARAQAPAPLLRFP